MFRMGSSIIEVFDVNNVVQQTINNVIANSLNVTTL